MAVHIFGNDVLEEIKTYRQRRGNVFEILPIATTMTTHVITPTSLASGSTMMTYQRRRNPHLHFLKTFLYIFLGTFLSFSPSSNFQSADTLSISRTLKEASGTRHSRGGDETNPNRVNDDGDAFELLPIISSTTTSLSASNPPLSVHSPIFSFSR